jgi:hypothetical protein
MEQTNVNERRVNMTEIYNTPRVIHIVETDKDGNKMTVRYIREDIIRDFANGVQMKLNAMLSKLDEPKV